MKPKLIFLGLVFLSLSLNAQQVSPTVIANAGGHGEASGMSVDWTLGELAITTLTDGNNVLTQGFHQPNLLSVNVVDKRPDIAMKLYPNPTANILRVEREGVETLDLQLLSIDGRVALSNRLEGSHTEMEVGNLPSGNYILNVILDDKIIKSFKIEKTGH